MSIRIFVEQNSDGEWVVFQENEESGRGRFEVDKFETKEEAEKFADDMQRATDKIHETEIALFPQDNPNMTLSNEQD